MDRESFIKAIIMTISEMAGEIWHIPEATDTAPSIARKAETTLAVKELVLGMRQTLSFDHPRHGRCTIYAVGAPTRLVVVGIDAYRINLELTKQLEDKMAHTDLVYRSHQMRRLSLKPALVTDPEVDGVWYEAEPLTYVAVVQTGAASVWERIRVFADVQYRADVPVSVSASTISTALLEGYARRIELLEQMRSLD